MYQFHVTVHARPADALPGKSLETDGRVVPILQIDPRKLSTPLSIGFDEACQSLARLPRMLVEPDGSFVWVGGDGTASWQVDGVLWDRGERLLFVDLKGHCPQADFDRLLCSLGWPEDELIFQLTRHAVFLDEAAFRQFAATRSSE